MNTINEDVMETTSNNTNTGENDNANLTLRNKKKLDTSTSSSLTAISLPASSPLYTSNNPDNNNSNNNNNNTNDNNSNNGNDDSDNSNSFFNRFLKCTNISPILMKESARTIIALITFLLTGFLCTYLIQLSDQRWRSSQELKPLVDVGFMLLPEIKETFLADLFMLTLLVGSITINLALSRSGVSRLIIIRRIFWMLALLVGFRMITLSVTTLPSPKSQCDPVSPGDFQDTLATSVKIIAGSIKACTDNIFSGHSTFITMSILMLNSYCKYRFIVYYSYLHGLVALIMLIATRMHYTIDVILAVFITYMVYSFYFSIVDLVIERHLLNIKKSEDRINDVNLYQKLVYRPNNHFNLGLIKIVKWMDGLDIRFKYEGLGESSDSIGDRIGNREEMAGAVDTGVKEMTQIKIVSDDNNDNNEDENEAYKILGSRIFFIFHKMNSFFMTFFIDNDNTSTIPRKSLFEYKYSSLINNLDEPDEKNNHYYYNNYNSNNKFNSLLILMFGSLILLGLYIYFVNLFSDDHSEY